MEGVKVKEWDVKWDWSKTGVVKKSYLEQDWSCEEELSSGTGSCIGSRVCVDCFLL